MTLRRAGRGATAFGLGLLALELAYLLVANGIIRSGLIQRAASERPQETELQWDAAFSPWPGRVDVRGFRLRLQDPDLEFCLTIEHAQLDVALPALLRRTFRASHVRAEGVRYRLLTKVDSPTGREARLAAFPLLEGLPRPALREPKVGPPPTAADRDSLWSVELDDVDATTSELWFVEFHYLGPGRVAGSFALAPLRTLWVRAATLNLQGGELSAGGHRLSTSFSALLHVSISPADLPSSGGLRVLRTLDGSLTFDAAVEDLGVADLYRPGLRARGTGRVRANLQVAHGKLMPGSELEVGLRGADLSLRGYVFRGQADARLSVSRPAASPFAQATVTGVLRIPLRGDESVAASLSGLTAELAFVDNDLSRGLRFAQMKALLGEARVRDARAITRQVGAVIPVLTSAVLGNGPLVGKASAEATSAAVLVRIKELHLGGAALQGAVRGGDQGWNGAAAGHFGGVALGLRLRQGKLEGVPLTPVPWLAEELLKVGIAAQ